MKKTVGFGIGVAVTLPLVIGLAIGFTVLDGVVIRALWNWFVRPEFHNAPKLSLAIAIGLGLFVSYMTFQQSSISFNAEDRWHSSKQLAYGIFFTGVIVLTGAIVHSFV